MKARHELEMIKIQTEAEKFISLRKDTLETINIGGQEILFLTEVSPQNNLLVHMYRWSNGKLFRVKAYDAPKE